MKKLLFILFVTVSLKLSAQTNVHSITPIIILGDTVNTIRINNSLNLNDSTVRISVTFVSKYNIEKQLSFPIASFRPFPSFAALKVKVLAAISTNLDITILN